MKIFITAIMVLFLAAPTAIAQETPPVISYGNTNTYTLGGVDVEGTQYYDKNVIRSLTGLIVGQSIDIPGDDISRAIRKLWSNNLFADVSIELDRVEGTTAYITIKVVEKPRLVDIEIQGIKSGDKDDIKEKLEALKRRPITEGMKISIKNRIRDFYGEKGF